MMRCIEFMIGLLAMLLACVSAGMPIGIRTAVLGRSNVRTPAEAVPDLGVNPSEAVVREALSGVADTNLTANIVNATEYAAFREWANCVQASDGAAPAGTQAVKESPRAWAAYALGATTLLDHEPTIEFGDVSIVMSSDDGSGTRRPAMMVSVMVKDGEKVVPVNAEKIAAMFEATSDLGDWKGASALVPRVQNIGGSGGAMRFLVTSGDGTEKNAFLRIRK